MRLDFHLHTHKSDGSMDPVALHVLVRQQKLKAWSITDHDTCAAYDEIQMEPGLICGVEITSAYEGHEIHIIGLGIDRHHTALQTLLEEIKHIRLERAQRMLTAINEERQCQLTIEDVKPAEAVVLTRFHIAQSLRSLGIIGKHREFFNELMNEQRMRSLDLPPYPGIEKVCDHIHQAGGQALLAHPSRYASFDIVERIMKLGLDGLEVKYPHSDPTIEKQLRKIAETGGYILSCGSDLHWPGRRKPGEYRLSHADAAPLLQRVGWQDPLKQ